MIRDLRQARQQLGNLKPRYVGFDRREWSPKSELASGFGSNVSRWPAPQPDQNHGCRPIGRFVSLRSRAQQSSQRQRTEPGQPGAKHFATPWQLR